MKRKYYFVIVLILFGGAWFLRWESTPINQREGHRITCLTDRWTGQQWIKYVGYFDGKLLTGEEYPKLNKGELQSLQKEKAISLGIVSLEKKLKENQQQEDAYYKMIDTEWNKTHNYEPSSIFEKFSWTRDMKKAGLLKPFPKQASKNISLYNYRIKKVNEQARNSAVSDLTKKAWEKRNFARLLWTGAFVVSLAFSLVPAFLKNKTEVTT